MEVPASRPLEEPSTSPSKRDGGGAAAALHAVQKPAAKPWKKPCSPSPKVYRVDPRGFRQLVQQLTGAAAEPQNMPAVGAARRRPLRDTAVPPASLNLAPPEVAAGLNEETSHSPTGFMDLLSPSFFSGWSSFPLHNPNSS